jgi:hypothetical protein
MAGFFFQPQRHQKGEEIAVQVLFPAYVTVVPYLWNYCFLPMKRECHASGTLVPIKCNRLGTAFALIFSCGCFFVM